MISKRKTGIMLMVIFTMSVFFTMTGRAIPASQTAHIIHTQDDEFITEVGIGIDSALLHILDPEMDIRARLHFRGIDINSWEVLDNATLILTSASTLEFDADSSVTIYGVKQADLQGLSGVAQYGPDTWLTFPLTFANVNVNTSQFYGGAVLNIDVTEIIAELIRDPHWDGDGLASAETGDDIGIIILGAEGSDTRYFYDYRGDPARSADLVINWGSAPPPPTGGGTFNETNRDFNIWVIDHVGTNRTGEGSDVNWNKLNMTELSEIDSGAAINVVDATTTEISAFQAQQINSLYNDTGGLGVNTYFVRFGLNISAITNAQAFDDRVGTVAGISTATPVGGGGLLEGAAGDFVGLTLTLYQDDERYTFRLMDRSGVNRQRNAESQFFQEDDNEILYFEYRATASWESVRIFSDGNFTNGIFSDERIYATASGPFRYPQIISSSSDGLSFINTAEYYTFLTDVVPENETWVVTYPNGTIVIDDLDSYDDAIIFIDDLLGPDPTDPAPPSQGWPGFGVFTRFKTRFYILLIGVFLIFGPLVTFALNRPSGYEFTIGAFIILIGFALMIAAGSV